MLSREKLWEAYLPRLAEAKRQDRLESTLVFLSQPVKVGRFKIAPLTLQRLLYLEALESPFIGGGGGRPPGRMDTLKLLWVMSPHFKPSKWRARVFVGLNFCWINWTWYAQSVGELFRAGMELMGENGGANKDEAKEVDPLWVAQAVDGFCSQYHWPLESVLNLPLIIMGTLGKAMTHRLSMGESKATHWGRHADAVKSEYLREVFRVDQAEMEKAERGESIGLN